MTDGPIGHAGVGRYGVRMATDSDDIQVRRSVNDANEGLRIRLAGRALPPLRPVAPELQSLVARRLDPKSVKHEEARNG
jgi:hypothetical protein